jgi:hypothetical protein
LSFPEITSALGYVKCKLIIEFALGIGYESTEDSTYEIVICDAGALGEKFRTPE